LAGLELSETSHQLQLSQFDNGRLWQEGKPNDYFETNDYFDLGSNHDSLEALERSSGSSTQEEAFPLPFHIPSYLRGSEYISSLEAVYWEMTHDTSGKTVEDDLLPPPSRWDYGSNSLDIELANDRVAFEYPGLIGSPDSESTCLRAHNPMPPQCEIYYFEVEIISAHEGKQYVSILPIKTMISDILTSIERLRSDFLVKDHPLKGSLGGKRDPGHIMEMVARYSVETRRARAKFTVLPSERAI
jgi:hypothetical protein